ncbi:HNH endonuclease [Rummeliibacillus stabekisii]|uniref:HNH endonuclease n=1 Tax=Rummeliibacillus stabekisii TaxID=241244 RepID=UPI003717308F
MNYKKVNPFYKSTAWRHKREEILKRDNYECLWCRKEGKVTTKDIAILEIDHINELDDYPELALENDNLRTLCKYHHNVRHNRFEGQKEKKWDDECW